MLREHKDVRSDWPFPVLYAAGLGVPSIPGDDTVQQTVILPPLADSHCGSRKFNVKSITVILQ
jgi:hypothetical protein